MWNIFSQVMTFHILGKFINRPDSIYQNFFSLFGLRGRYHKIFTNFLLVVFSYTCSIKLCTHIIKKNAPIFFLSIENFTFIDLIANFFRIKILAFENFKIQVVEFIKQKNRLPNYWKIPKFFWLKVKSRQKIK